MRNIRLTSSKKIVPTVMTKWETCSGVNVNGKRIGQRQDWEDCRQDGGFHCGGIVNPMKVKRAEKAFG